MKYTINQFKKDFPDDEACLEYVFRFRYGHIPDFKKYYRVTGRKCYAHSETGHQIHPLAGTIFHKSSTKLTNWFFAIFLASQSKNGVSAKELERSLGVTYKCAWRIAKQIRSLMSDDGIKLSGIVEADETYIGGYRPQGHGGKGKIAVMGAVERGGAVKTEVLKDGRQTGDMLSMIMKNIEANSTLYTDQFGIYQKTKKMGYTHQSVNHWKKEFVKGVTHTNTIEGYWSQLKRSIIGTYHVVSPKYLPSYLYEFSFRYNLRNDETPIFYHLLGRLVS